MSGAVLSHIEFTPKGAPLRYRCHACGTLLAEKRGFLRKYRATPVYGEMLLDMDKGTRHVAGVCLNCLEGEYSLDTLQDWYDADVDAWEEQSRLRGEGLEWAQGVRGRKVKGRADVKPNQAA